MTGTAFVRGVLVPVAILVAAFVTVFYTAMLGSFGPLDGAAGAGLAAGLWVVAPVAGGALVRDAENRHVVLAAVLLGALVALAVTSLYVTAAGTAALRAACTPYPRSAVLYVLGCVAVGLLAGAGMAVGVTLTARLTAAGRWLAGVFLGSGANFALALAAYFFVYSVVTCLRP